MTAGQSKEEPRYLSYVLRVRCEPPVERGAADRLVIRVEKVGCNEIGNFTSLDAALSHISESVRGNLLRDLH